jgi:outer membrane protein TolC
MRLFGATLTCAAALALAGCAAVGPDYALPDRAVANAPAATGGFMGASEKAVSPKPAVENWWSLYDDPVLDGLVRQALAANTDLRIAAANIGRAQAALAVAEDARLPSTGIDGAFEYGQLSGEQYLLSQPLPSMGLYSSGIGVSYQVDLFGQIRRGIEAAKADEEAARAAADVARITVAAETVRAYVEACGAGHELEVARSSGATS